MKDMWHLFKAVSMRLDEPEKEKARVTPGLRPPVRREVENCVGVKPLHGSHL
jgi:hypothetical protein